MFLQFHRAVEYLDLWSASSADISFRHHICQSGGPLHGRRGFLATWRPLHSRRGRGQGDRITVRDTSPDAEAACNTMLGVLEQASRGAAQANNAAPLSVNFR